MDEFVSDDSSYNSTFNMSFATLGQNNDTPSDVTSTKSPLLGLTVLDQIAWTLTFGVMLVVAVAGNLLVVWIVLVNRGMRTVTNYFLLNLSFADLAMSTFNCSVTFRFFINGHWDYGEVYCIVNNCIASTTVASGCFTLVAISLDRYVAIVHPLRPRLSRRKATSIIFVIWTLSFLISIPSVLYSETFSESQTNGEIVTICYMRWPDGDPGVSLMDYIYNMVFLLITYMIPVFIMVFTYSHMNRILWGNEKGIGESSQTQIQNIRAKRKIVRMFIAIVAFFTTCWLPYHIYFLYQYHDPGFLSTSYVRHIYLGCYWLAMSNAMINPVLYYAMNTRFRYHFKSVFCDRKYGRDGNPNNNLTLNCEDSHRYRPARIFRYNCNGNNSVCKEPSSPVRSMVLRPAEDVPKLDCSSAEHDAVVVTEAREEGIQLTVYVPSFRTIK